MIVDNMKIDFITTFINGFVVINIFEIELHGFVLHKSKFGTLFSKCSYSFFYPVRALVINIYLYKIFDTIIVFRY